MNKKTTELANIHNRNVQRIYWFRTHTWIILVLLLVLLISTVFQSLIVWEGDLLPYYGAAIRRSRDSERSLKIAVESHEQTASLRVICSLILIFGSSELLLRWLFLTFAGFRVHKGFNRVLRIVIFLSFCSQCFSILLRIGTLTSHVHWVSVLGLLLNFALVILQSASFVEIADYYHEYQRALQLALDSVTQQRISEINQQRQRQPASSSYGSSPINSMISKTNTMFPSLFANSSEKNKKN